MERGNVGATFGTYAEAHVASLSVDDIIRAAKAAGVRLTDSDVVAIACAQVPGGLGARLPMCVPAKGPRQ